jgi:hypothetical protein
LNQLQNTHNLSFQIHEKFDKMLAIRYMGKLLLDTMDMQSADPLEQWYGLGVLSIAELGLGQAVQELGVVF